MTINKFQGKTKEEAIEKAKQEMGPGAVIMNVKEIKPKGIFAAFKSSTYEATAALEEKDHVVSSFSALQSPQKLHDNINVAADEKIEIPKAVRTPEIERPVADPRKNTSSHTERTVNESQELEERAIGKRLDDLSNMLEEKLGVGPKEENKEKTTSSEELDFVRIIYRTLLNNEVNERYANQIIDEVERFIRPGNSVDTILANVYQKLILKLGRPNTIETGKGKARVIFFIGPTGVGKTTTIAKIASKYKMESNQKVAFITADTYRIAATEQLRVYANILDAPMSIVYSPDELNSAVAKLMDYDLIFVDTAGFSHKNETQREDMKKLIGGLAPEYDKEVYLVLSATTKYQDLLEIVDIYHEISEFKLIFTKLDETTAYGNILNVKLYSGADLSYVTNGQNVPADLEVFHTQKIVKQLLGGR
ncbi:MAG: flagellar biosynthesis protein FlhF [Agathobacter sp.]|nr:flagellar biosynthesis protein FlhF [Agathobacter sp.]